MDEPKSPSGTVPSPPPSSQRKQLAEEWLKAVETNKPTKALSCAAKLCPDLSWQIPTFYAKFSERHGISRQFLVGPFNPYDFQYWRHCLLFKKIKDDAIASVDTGPDNEIPLLFEAVTSRIANRALSKNTIPWPYNVWSGKQGLCDRQAWVLCELAHQADYLTRIVYLRNPEKLVDSPHTVCEIRKDGQVWLADPLSKKLLKNKTVLELMTDPALTQSLWPRADQEQWRRAATKPFYWTPSYPQSFCPRNQHLFEVLQQELGGRIAVFGIPPESRRKSYNNCLNQQEIKIPHDFWFFPFILLKREITENYEKHLQGNANDTKK